MIFSLKKNSEPDSTLSQIKSFTHLMKSYPLHDEGFLHSLEPFIKTYDTKLASIYLFESRTNMFLLKKWCGEEPSRHSISADYEFVKYLHVNNGVVYRKAFEQKMTNELREPALFYFQQTLSNTVFPILDQGKWVALINLKVEFKKNTHIILFDLMLSLYADALKKWIQHQEVVQDNKKLSEISHVKNQLLANVTHELQTPLHGILGMTEVMAESAKNHPELIKQIEMIRKSGEDLHRTVEGIIKLMQIESKKSEQKFEKVGIFEIIHEIAGIYSETCQSKKIRLVLPKNEGNIFVFADPDQIRTVLINLLSNAVKFTQKGEIKLDLHKSVDMLRVSVCDTGIGIDDDKLSLIFEEFYQVDGSHTRIYGGTGLGLAIVKKIISLHGGKIWVESQKGTGSRFTFTLPMYPV